MKKKHLIIIGMVITIIILSMMVFSIHKILQRSSVPGDHLLGKSYPEYPPPGYKILCNATGEYIAEMPYGTKLYQYEGRYKPYKNYQGAVDRAWAQYEFENPPADTVIWKECE